MDEKSLELLEFPKVREQIAGLTSFMPGRELALGIMPLADYEHISLLLKQSAEARLLLSTVPTFSISDVLDIRETVKLAALGKIIEPRALQDVQVTLGGLAYLRGRLSRLATELPLLWQIALGIIELRDLEKEIGGCFLPDGQVRDDASPKLTQIRQKLKSVRAELLTKLQGIIDSPKWQASIQEPLVTEREGRYVIPIKNEFRKNVRGIVHDVSNTGATVFVEPWVTIDYGNRLRELEIEEKYEVERILRDLSGRVGMYASSLSHSINLVAEIDLALAKARYARRHDAIEPQLLARNSSNEPVVLRLIEARHPLLGTGAVPLSVEIGRDFSILVITGPNTGGKTVALKTIGILSLMAQAGLPVPAASGTCIPLFDNVFADIGDEQSIAQTLSTFSWHVSNIVRIINSMSRHSLVLLDELGTSTDPAEGAALARSLLLYLKERQVKAVATTHFSELKAFAHATSGLQNASLDFDPVTLAPTYHLTVGIPGGSNALATASRLGLPAEIVDTAREMLSRSSQEMERLLSDLVIEKQYVTMARDTVTKESAELARQQVELARQVQHLHIEERRILQEERDKVVREAAELHREIRQALSDLRKARSKERVEMGRQTLAAIEEKLKSQSWASPVSETVIEDKISPGDTVWLKETGVVATVLQIAEGNGPLELQIGAAKLRVGRDAIEKIGTPVKQIVAPSVTRNIEKKRVPLELDLRGKRAEAVTELLDAYLNDAAVADMRTVRIIHGLGTGVVRQIVRDTLAAHPLVKNWRPGGRGEGGDGATVVGL